MGVNFTKHTALSAEVIRGINFLSDTELALRRAQMTAVHHLLSRRCHKVLHVRRGFQPIPNTGESSLESQNGKYLCPLGNFTNQVPSTNKNNNYLMNEVCLGHMESI